MSKLSIAVNLKVRWTSKGLAACCVGFMAYQGRSKHLETSGSVSGSF